MKKVAFAIIMVCAFFALLGTMLAKANTEYETALHYYFVGKYEKAIRLLKDYVEKKADPSAYYYIGYALYKIGKYDEANRYFEMTYLIDPVFSPKQIMSLQKHTESRKEVKKPRKTVSLQRPSGDGCRENRPEGEKRTSLNGEYRTRKMMFLSLLYIIASQKG